MATKAHMSVWECKKSEYLDKSHGKAMCRPRKKLLEKPPAELRVVLPLKKSMKTMKGVSNQLRREYGLDFGYSPEGEGYEMVFYGSDLRSYCGELIEFGYDSVELELRTRYWLDWEQDRKNGQWVNKDVLIEQPSSYNRKYKEIVKNARHIIVGGE